MTKAIIIGAGFSCDLGMPSSTELSKIFFEKFNLKTVKNHLIPNIFNKKPYGNDIVLSKDAFADIIEIFKNNTENNYENFIKQIENIEYKGSSNNYTHTIRYFISILYEYIYNFFLYCHSKSYPAYKLMKSTYRPFINYLSDSEETWILSLNHDLIVEFLALDYDIPIKFGASILQNYLLDNEKNRDKIINFYKLCRDDYNIDKMDFFNNKKGINLIKLHGGLNKFSFGDNGNYNYGKNLLYVNWENCKNSEEYHSLVQNINNKMTYYVNGKNVPIMKEIAAPYTDKDSFELLRKSMLTGGRKFSSKLGDDTGTAMFLLRQVLSKVDNVDIVGYGFNDVHINDRIDEAMILNPSLNLNISLYDTQLKLPHCIERHNCNDRIKRSYGFGTPEWFHLQVVGDQKHPEKQKIENFRKLKTQINNLIYTKK